MTDIEEQSMNGVWKSSTGAVITLKLSDNIVQGTYEKDDHIRKVAGTYIVLKDGILFSFNFNVISGDKEPSCTIYTYSGKLCYDSKNKIHIDVTSTSVSDGEKTSFYDRDARTLTRVI